MSSPEFFGEEPNLDGDIRETGYGTAGQEVASRQIPDQQLPWPSSPPLRKNHPVPPEPITPFEEPEGAVCYVFAEDKGIVGRIDLTHASLSMGPSRLSASSPGGNTEGQPTHIAVPVIQFNVASADTPANYVQGDDHGDTQAPKVHYKVVPAVFKSGFNIQWWLNFPGFYEDRTHFIERMKKGRWS